MKQKPLSAEDIMNRGYFNLKQCTYSPIAHDHNIDNYPGSDYNWGSPIPELRKDRIIFNLHELFKYCINPLVRKYGEDLGLTSVYRNMKVNKLLGGTPNSQHCYGHAADIVLTNGVKTTDLFNWCVLNLPKYHQIIWEYPEKGEWNSINNSFSWVHISYIKGNNEKINSVSSTDPRIHKFYKDEDTFFLDNFTHRIKIADPEILD